MSSENDTYSKESIIKLIETYGEVESFHKDFKGFDIYVLENGSVIRLPNDFSRIPFYYVAQIASEKLDLPQMEFDYWLGEQDKAA